MLLGGRRSAEPEHRYSWLLRPAGFSRLPLRTRNRQEVCLAHRLGSLCSVRGRTELFQFKLAAVERHHFGNAGNSELARDRSTDKHVQRLVALEIEDYSHFRTLVQFRNGH